MAKHRESEVTVLNKCIWKNGIIQSHMVKKKKENTAAGRKYYTRYGPIRIKLWLLTSIQGSKTSFT